MPEVAVIGRFQPFHWGHFEYLTEAGRYSARLTVGITNPSVEWTRHTRADAKRSSDEANPFTYEQRSAMISTSLALLTPHLRPRVVPCDLRSPTTLRSSLGACDLVALTVYDAWGREKQALAEAAGYDVLVLWERTEKLVTGTEVRRRWRNSLPWDHMVPSGTAETIRSLTG
ncbi:cytidyltransferase-like protein [Streptomyces sp. 3330]|uniref:adenylyltransferase/cytidyltransferase family protein n=1 Tax=Streptomyces sp. 3330 TaxID=2817755 RepID=UPI00285AA156|nr:adenylyltransferase/cytidyltransferase family protein [Streptomyces sp. 3330]MDR6979040.1 cytidyltransferase-like protein [Streptomyces sp. 3330]